jgi:hypothetical protein
MHQPHIPRDIGSITEPNLTQHACTRMQQRGIRKSDVELVLQYGRCIHARGVVFYVIGRKEVARWAALNIDLSSLAGVQVLATREGVVVTTYRSHNLHAIQAVPGRKSQNYRRTYH